ncbi:MAG: hypothetical protein QOI27_1467 [Gaiellaceae bacterium]|jgi:hypothetical protein|nr:hypothetical protein [Gaiellaceae bacterium]MDX6471888.1 hypothetical protein [Gaiellaceae bacterium]
MVPHLWRPGISWRFFDLGARLLFSNSAGGGLHLYASHPMLQIGPLSFLVAAPLRLADPWHGRITAIVLMTALGPVLLWLIGTLRVVGAHAISRQRLALAGVVFLPIWTEVAAHFAHLDDVLALTFAVLALHAVNRNHAVLAGLLLGCAADSKPWAAAFIPLVFVLEPRLRRRAAAAWALTIAGAWLPFLLADPRSLRVASFTIPNAGSSALRALGVYDARTPSWDRPMQLVLGCALAWVLVRTGRWPAALFAVITVRLLFDPGTYAYYTSGLVLAAILVDLLLTTRRIPLYALSAAVVVYAARATPLDVHALGLLRATYCVAALTTLFLPHLRRLSAVTASA